MAETPNPKALQAVRYSKLALGIPYAWGGTNYKTGVDCSGLIYTAYNLGAGVILPRTSEGMYGDETFKPINIASAIPGDLCFSEMGSGGPGHVVMAVGGGNCIAAEHTGTRVQIMTLPAALGSSMIKTAKRPLPAVGQGSYSGGQVIDSGSGKNSGGGSSFLGGLTSGFSALTDPHTYYRAGQVILGALFVFIGIFMMAAGNSNVQSAAKGVAQVAMVAE